VSQTDNPAAPLVSRCGLAVSGAQGMGRSLYTQLMLSLLQDPHLHLLTTIGQMLVF
jgi:hypothetical protein